MAAPVRDKQARKFWLLQASSPRHFARGWLPDHAISTRGLCARCISHPTSHRMEQRDRHQNALSQGIGLFRPRWTQCLARFLLLQVLYQGLNTVFMTRSFDNVQEWLMGWSYWSLTARVRVSSLSYIYFFNVWCVSTISREPTLRIGLNNHCEAVRLSQQINYCTQERVPPRGVQKT